MQSQIHPNFIYLPLTGVLIRKASGKRWPTMEVGNLDREGYLRFEHKGVLIGVHKVAYEIATNNEIPKGYEVDHINKIKTDNRICNLRLVTKRINCLNKTNNTKFKGVLKHRDKFKARISINNKRVHLGVFNTREEAHKAYMNKVMELEKCQTLN